MSDTPAVIADPPPVLALVPLRVLARRLADEDISWNRAADADIAQAMGWRVKREFYWKIFDAGTRRWVTLPHYTLDIPAAAQLVPAGFWWRLLCAQDRRFSGEVGLQADDHKRRHANGCVFYSDAFGISFHSAATALAACALDVRGQMAERGA